MRLIAFSTVSGFVFNSIKLDHEINSCPGREVIIKIILHEFILTYKTFKIIMY